MGSIRGDAGGPLLRRAVLMGLHYSPPRHRNPRADDRSAVRHTRGPPDPETRRPVRSGTARNDWSCVQVRD